MDRQIETIFKAEPPFEEIKNGHGYLGILLRDINEDKIQCHLCGDWFKALPSHAIKAHGLNANDYRIEFQLPLGLPLASRSTLWKHSQRAMKKENLDKLAIARLNSPIANKGYKRKKFPWKYFRKNRAHENKFNLCSEQIVRRFMIVSDLVGREPTQKDLEKHDEPVWAAIRRRHKNINNFRKKHGFTVVERDRIWEDDQIISELRRFNLKHDRIPRAKDFRSSSPTDVTIRKRFGSWHNAMILAGFLVK